MIPIYRFMAIPLQISVWLSMWIWLLSFFPWLYVGGGISVFVHGQLLIVDMVVDTSFQPVLEQIRTKLTITTEIYPMAGILLKPTKNSRIGFTYRKEGRFNVSGGNQISLSLYLDADTTINLPMNMVVPAQGHYNPRQYALGVAYQFTDKLLLATDLTYYDWQPSRDESDRALSPAMKEIFVPRAGMEYALFEHLSLRAGYSFQESPLRQQNLGQPINLLDNDVHSVTFGLGLLSDLAGLLDKPAGWSIFYELQVLAPRTFQNVHAGGPALESSGMFHSFGVGIQFKL